MITESGIRQLKKYCRESIENIKGYREAVESKSRYHCHHINELTFTRDELKKMNMYYDRPASELIIMTRSQHKKWHHKWNGNPMKGRTGDKNPMYGRTCEQYPQIRKSGDKNGRWKGDEVGPIGMYKRALKLYKSGQITEEEFQTYRDMKAEYLRSRR